MSQYPTQPPEPPPAAVSPLGYETAFPAPNPAMAIASLVLGILSLLCACAPMINVLTPVLAIVALVLGALGFRQARGAPGGGAKGMALAGMICGGINLTLFAGMAAYLLLAVARAPAPRIATPPVVAPPATNPTTVPAQ